MLQIQKFLVRSISLTANELSWEINQYSEDPLNYTFQIYRSPVQASGYEAISPTFSDKYYFIDNQLPPTGRWNTLYYKIKVSDAGGASEYTSATHIGTTENKYALEITRRERMAFHRFAGTRVFVLPIRTFGRRCSCFDEITKKTIRPNCVECYGTTFSGGYHAAVETYAQVKAYKHTTREMPAAGVPIQPAGTIIQLINYPLVKRGDVVIEPRNNERWQVGSITPNSLAGVLISQRIEASLIDTSKIQYKIDLKDFDVFSLNEPPNLVDRQTSW